MEGRRVGGTELQQNIVWWLFGNVEIEIEQWKNSSVVEKGLEILSPCIDWARGICQDVAKQHDKCRLRHDKKMTVKITYRDIRGHFLNEVGFLWDEDLCHVWELASLLDYPQNMPGEIVDKLQIKLSFWKDQNWILRCEWKFIQSFHLLMGNHWASRRARKSQKLSRTKKVVADLPTFWEWDE